MTRSSRRQTRLCEGGVVGFTYRRSWLANPAGRSQSSFLSRKASLSLGSVGAGKAAMSLGSGHARHSGQAAWSGGTLGASRTRRAVFPVLPLVAHIRIAEITVTVKCLSLPSSVCFEKVLGDQDNFCFSFFLQK